VAGKASGQVAGRKLVIVESPPKGRKIAGYLGPDFDVEASLGHIRDIPTPSELPADMKKGPFGKFGVDVDNGFRALLRRRRGQEEEGRRTQAPAEGRRRALPRH
jgi:DNA topoisomerase-1